MCVSVCECVHVFAKRVVLLQWCCCSSCEAATRSEDASCAIHTTICVSAYYYICVLILLYMCTREARGAVAKVRIRVKKRARA
jgi:hypothetical protein